MPVGGHEAGQSPYGAQDQQLTARNTLELS